MLRIVSPFFVQRCFRKKLLRDDQRGSTAVLLLPLLLLRPKYFLKRPCATPTRSRTSAAFKGRVPAWGRTRTAFGASEQPRQRAAPSAHSRWFASRYFSRLRLRGGPDVNIR